MAAADGERRPDPTLRRSSDPGPDDGGPGRDGDTVTAPDRVSIHGIADKVKGLLRPRD